MLFFESGSSIYSEWFKQMDLTEVEALIPKKAFHQNVWISESGCFTPVHFDEPDNFLVQVNYLEKKRSSVNVHEIKVEGQKRVVIWKPEASDILKINDRNAKMRDRQTRLDFTDPNLVDNNPGLNNVTLQKFDII